MATDRLSAVLRAIGDAQAANGSDSTVDHVCLAAVDLLTLSGAGLSLMVDGDLRGTAGVSEPGIAAIQELQLALGEGPCVDAWTLRHSVLEPDLAAPAHTRWPAFTHAGVQTGVRAVFAFPLQLGAIRLGVLALYRDHPGELDADQFAHALVLADLAAEVVLSLQADAPADVLHQQLGQEPAHWAEIHQATGIASVQLEVPLDVAFARLRAHAFARERSLKAVAADIAAHRLRLGSDG